MLPLPSRDQPRTGYDGSYGATTAEPKLLTSINTVREDPPIFHKVLVHSSTCGICFEVCYRNVAAHFHRIRRSLVGAEHFAKCRNYWREPLIFDQVCYHSNVVSFARFYLKNITNIRLETDVHLKTADKSWKESAGHTTSKPCGVGGGVI